MLTKLTELGDQCPTCNQQIDPVFMSKLIAEEEFSVAKAQDIRDKSFRDITEIKEANTKPREKKEAQREWEELYKSVDETIPTTLIDEDILKEEVSSIKDKLSKAVAKNKEIEAENRRRLEHNARVKLILEQTSKYTKQLEQLSEEVAEIDSLASNLEVLKKAFSTNGLIAYKIENLVKELEDLTNQYLAELSDGRFTLSFVVLNDKLNVEITDDGKIVDILSLSSGELARVNTATLIAIRKLMSSISKSKINVLFLDEVIAVLDDVGREKLVEILLAEEDLNTYIVSHHWEHPLLSKLNITKTDNISTIEG